MSSRRLLLALLPLLAAAGCARNPDLVYWREAKVGPHVSFRLVHDLPLPFCPDRIAPQASGFALLSGGRTMVLSPEGEPRDGPPSETAFDPAPFRGVADAIDGVGEAEPVAVWENRVYLLDRAGGKLHAIRTPKAKRLWTFHAGAAIEAAPQIDRGRILVQSLDNYVYCLRADNGHEMWRARLSNRLTRPLAFWRDRVLVAPQTSAALDALSMVDGSPAGSFELEGADEHVVAGPAVSGDRVAIAHAPWGAEHCSLLLLEPSEGGG